MRFTDSHTHLYFPEFNPDREDTIQRALDAGVEYMINVGTDLESARRCLDLAEKYDGIYAAAGIHPHDAARATDHEMAGIREILKHPHMVAIGEVGLDFFRNLSPQDMQIQTFEKFLHLHQETGKPLIIHCRDAYEKIREVMLSVVQPPFRGVMHCYSSDKDTMLQFLDMGFYISFAGPLTYKKNDALREACRACPLDRLLLETDAPFLAPEPFRGKRNEPGFMIETARMAAKLHGISLEAMGDATTQNAVRLFGLC